MFRLTDEPIDTVTCRDVLLDDRAGGLVAFEGRVRDHNGGRAVVALEYEAYAALAEKEGRRILDEARARFAVEAVGAVHRTGRLAVGDVAVWVGVAAGHRGAAFEACRYVIDELKGRVPIWKREHYADGTVEWVNAAAGLPDGPGAG